MERRRIPYERERWLSAVLIVTAIAGASVVVPRWPLAVPPAPQAAPHLPARALALIELPDALFSASLSSVRTSSPEPGGVAAIAEAPAVADAVAAIDVPRSEAPAPPAAAAVASGGAVPPATLLASRRVELAGVLHPLTDDDPLASPSSPHAFVEIPAVVVTRAVMVAGRGIRSGLRATSAVFRAAF